MKAITPLLLLCLTSTVWSQDLPDSYYKRPLKAYQLGSLHHSIEWHVGLNANLHSQYDFFCLGGAIDLINLEGYKGATRSALDITSALALKATLGFNALLDYRSSELANSWQYSYKVKDAYGAIMPFVQAQLIIRYFDPIHFKIGRGIGYQFQFRNYAMKKEYNEWTLSSSPGREPVQNKTTLKERSNYWQLMTRYAIMLPFGQNTRYIELGVSSNSYFEEPFWQVYFSLGFGLSKP